MTQTPYLDASALTAVALKDATGPAVEAALGGFLSAPLISDLAWGEFIAATGGRVRTRDVRDTVARAIIAAASERMASAPLARVNSADLSDAIDFLTDFELALKLPDAIHIAIARRLGATLVSTDRQQVAAARKLDIPCINPLEVAP